MSLRRFWEHLRDPNPAFECRPAGNDQGRFIVCVEHKLGIPASEAALGQLREHCGSWSDSLCALYEHCNGMQLYNQSLYDACGFEFVSIEAMESTKQAMLEWKLQLGTESEVQEAFGGVVFAETPHSGNFWILKTSGEYAGSVVHSDHEEWSDEPFAPSVGALLRRMYNDPAKFLNDIGCFARYSDGKTKTQWIPQKYLPNASV